MRPISGFVLLGGAIVSASITFGQPPGPPFPVPTDEHISMMVGHLMEFDSNQDGRLSKTEAKQLPPFAAKFDKADTNKDGVLTREELTAFVKKDIATMGRGPGGTDGPDAMDGRGTGRKGRGASERAGTDELGRSMLGQVLPEPAQDKLKLTAGQKKRVKDLQKMVDAKIAQILTDEQERQFEEMKQSSSGVPESDIEKVPVAADLDRPLSKTKISGPKHPGSGSGEPSLSA